MIRTAVHTFVVLALVSLGTSIDVDCIAASPFVAGFERFSRHEDIDDVTSGRLLLSELSCAACHTSTDAALEPKSGPNLESAGLVLRHEWVSEFLSDPQSTKPGTTMPNMLSSVNADERGAVVDALTAYVLSREKQFREVKGSGLVPVPHEFWNKGNADTGLGLYHQIGCVACHEPDAKYTATARSDSQIDKLIEQLGPDELEEMGLGAAARRVDSIPHSNLNRKYTMQGLTMFLLDPLQSRTAGRMPSFKLQPIEAANLSAYLHAKDKSLASAKGDATANHPTENLVSIGREWFAKLNCVQCHETGEKLSKRSFKELANLDVAAKRNCLADSEKPVEYSLDTLQVTSIAAALRELGSHAEVNATLQHTMLQLNCYACHERGEVGGVGRNRKPYFETVGSVDLGDEGRLPPPLTGAGRKLQVAWFKKVLLGDKADIRPHMRIRMPMFHSQIAETIPTFMAAVDRASDASDREVFGSHENATKVGRLLMDVGCIQCHKFRGFGLPGIVGVDLKGITNRVRPEWFRSFILNPGSVKARTRMPTFFPDGKSQVPTETYGDVDQQVASIWSYLKELDQEPLPENVLQANSQNYELKPENRPVILRTFMPDAGTHAIAVGFPNGLNFAFDAEKMRLATIWRGRFLDARGTWFERSAPPASPLGEDVVHLAAIVPFVLGEDEPSQWPKNSDGYRFKGYRLDNAGVPTFIYSFQDLEFEDRIFPANAKVLVRYIRVTSKSFVPKSAWLAVQTNVPGTNGEWKFYGANQESVPIGVEGVVAKPVTLFSGVQLGLSYRW